MYNGLQLGATWSTGSNFSRHGSEYLRERITINSCTSTEIGETYSNQSRLKVVQPIGYVVAMLSIANQQDNLRILAAVTHPSFVLVYFDLGLLVFDMRTYRKDGFLYRSGLLSISYQALLTLQLDIVQDDDVADVDVI